MDGMEKKIEIRLIVAANAPETLRAELLAGAMNTLRRWGMPARGGAVVVVDYDQKKEAV